ncbi:MAG: hypothetical protein F2673_02880 [Actinobacteria bacterium]|uniref:Unannotated protein n=1 Tax=freshwater metagenome TaxID=449393 RepID=A0A6J6PP39_9ZZZZ|nr:hypothetical protein [Actinomycetota bacterium]
MLNTLGADVLLVEPIGGSSVRTLAPFAGDTPHPERSLPFVAWNRGKRSIELDLGTESGASQLTELARTADVLIESGVVDVDLAALREANPALVTISISAFGTTGPKAPWPATDLTAHAAAGQLLMTGDEDRPPVRTTEPQVFQHAAADAACAALVALAERDSSGLGQHIDISAQRSMLMATQSNVLAAPYRAPLFQRTATGHLLNGVHVQLIWPCKDGHVLVNALFGAPFAPFIKRLVEWAREDGFCGDDLVNEDWPSFGARVFGGETPIARHTYLKEVIGKVCEHRTKAELLQAALDRKLLIGPIATMEEVVENPQFAFRNFFELVTDPEISPVPFRAPGSPVHADTKYVPLGRSPRLGEHSATALRHWAPRTETPSREPGNRQAPFAGLKVLDLTWAVSGPYTARHFADYGATVIHVESTKGPDSARAVQPFLDNLALPENAAIYHNMNAGKLSLSLNMASPGGREVLDDLVAWADVLIESFSPRGRLALGLDYERLRVINPQLVMMSTCLFGQQGPMAGYAGFGNMAACLVGFFDLTGWPDRGPAGPFGAYTDYISPRYAFATLLAGLRESRATGRGQYLDFAQAESAVNFLSVAMLDYSVNGRVAARIGNDDPAMSPHGVYPCTGTDRWVAVACRDDSDWHSLAWLIGRSDLASLNNAERLERRGELNDAVAAWTGLRSPSEAEAELIAHRVPAHAVIHSPDIYSDPQLAHLGHFAEIPHPHHGSVTVEASRFGLTGTPSTISNGAPSFGLHTVDLLTETLGYDLDRIGELFSSGALD